MGAIYHIRFDGSLDISRYPEFREAFLGAPDGAPVLIDLTATQSVDSLFLAEMMMFKRRHRGRVAAAIEPRGHVARLFRLVDLGEKMNVYESIAAATDWLESTVEHPSRTRPPKGSPRP